MLIKLVTLGRNIVLKNVSSLNFSRTQILWRKPQKFKKVLNLFYFGTVVHVMASEQMQKVDLVKDKLNLTQAQINYMRLAQQQNEDRVNRLRALRRSNLRLAAILGVSVIGVFGYSLWSVGSEKILDDFDFLPKPNTPKE